MIFVKGLLLFVFVVSVLADPSIVTIPDGTIQGIATSYYRSFLGIPFAAPPVGTLRWSAPNPAIPWKNTLDGTKFAAGCPQNCILPPHTCPTQQSEDCLTLNVWTPGDLSPNTPVMVFFPGGRYEQGSAGTGLYNGSFIVNTTGVIIVTSNYRLGVLGWLVTDSLSGNFALQDQRLALEWVQQNIKYFGGDPTQVTVFGQSAGAGSTVSHLISPKSKGLFSKAIIESNPFTLPLKPMDKARYLGNYFAKSVGCGTEDIVCLRNLNVSEIVQYQTIDQKKVPYLHPLDLFLPWTPSVDGEEVPLDAFTAFSTGQYNTDVPIVVGTVSQDALFFVYEAAKANVSDADYALLASYLFEFHAATILEMYPPHSIFHTGDNRPVISELGTDYVFVCSTRKVAGTMAQHSPAVYVYQFNHVLSFDPWGEYQWCEDAVCHGAELPLLWHVAAPFYTFTADEERLSENIIQYWTNFAKSGTPNGPSTVTVEWPTFNATSNEVLILQTPQNVVNNNVRTQYCDYFDSIGYLWGT